MVNKMLKSLLILKSLHNLDNLIGDIVQATYPNLLGCSSTHSRGVKKVNYYVLSPIPCVGKEYLNCDTICKCDEDVGVDHQWIISEFLKLYNLLFIMCYISSNAN
jgi:hypothetical protein